ncbi:MAG TPA: hypothetical protein PK913_10125, partial [Phenylobacterium sp.]|nr:hypothetical protein [Phenylobacterium sp.]
LSAGLVVAADATPAASTTQTTLAAAAATAKPQKICKSIKTLGSRLPVKKCQTVEEAADEEAQAQQAVRDMQRSAPPPNQ